MSPQSRPLVLSMMSQRAGITVPVTLRSLMPSERLSLPPLVTVLIVMIVVAAVTVVVVVTPLRFGDRPAGDGGEGDESHGENGSG